MQGSAGAGLSGAISAVDTTLVLAPKLATAALAGGGGPRGLFKPKVGSSEGISRLVLVACDVCGLLATRLGAGVDG